MQKLAAALVAFQAEAPVVHKSATNPHFRSKYAPLDEIVKRVQPILAKHGLAVMQFPVGDLDTAGVITHVIHESGEMMSQEFRVPLVKRDAQGACSAITYARRYGLAGALGLVTDDDDDGNAAVSPAAEAAIRKPMEQPKPRAAKKPLMDKEHRDKIKDAADRRAKDIGDDSLGPDEIIRLVAKSMGYKSPADMPNKCWETAFSLVQEFEPGEAAA